MDVALAVRADQGLLYATWSGEYSLEEAQRTFLQILACLEQQGCRLLTSVNAPSEFSFQCWPTPPPVKLP